jgi:choline-sulfatase
MNKLKTYDKIIWISLDTLRADCINFNKTKLYPREYKIKTKLKNSKLDELFSKGCFFNNAISVTPYTSASHAAYFTGLWPKNNGVYDQFNSKLKVKNIFQTAKKNGFSTLFKTDFPFVLGKYLNLIKGVDDYLIEDNEKFLKKLKTNKKTFSFIHFGQIHYPYGFHNLEFGGKDYINKVNELEKKYDIDSKKINLEDMAVETFRSKKDLELLYKYKKIIAKLYSSKKDDDLFNLYLEGINYFHEKLFNSFLEKLLNQVEKENYLLIISADHGEAWNKETYGHHNSLDEGVIRVPILFYAKDIKPKIYSNRIRTIDVVPTLNELLFENKEKCDGKTLASIIYKNKKEKNRLAFSAVWVNESKDVLKKVNDIVKKDKMNTTKNIGVKYSAAVYKDDYKFTKNYKLFTNRSEKIVDFKREELFNTKDLKKFKKIKNPKVEKTLLKKMNALNNVQLQKRKSQKDTMKEYFNLMGYKI